MNPLNEISLVVFGTTIGHQGFKDIYKYTLRHLNDNLGFSNFGGHYAALKVHNGDEDQFIEMAKYFKGFNLIKEIGYMGLSANPQGNQEEYAKYMTGSYSRSIANMFSWFYFNTKYVLWLEDDCLIMSDGKALEHIQKAKEYLDANPDVFSIHMDAIEFPLENDDLFGPTKYAFRPHLVRTERMIDVANCFKFNYLKIKDVHPELVYEMTIKHLYPNASFVKWNSKYLSQLHLGQSDFHAIANKYNLKS